MIIIIKGFTLSMLLRSVGMKILCVLLKSGRSHNTVYGLPNLTKRRFLGKFEYYNIIHVFKNYFTTVFLANKRYPNRL